MSESEQFFVEKDVSCDFANALTTKAVELARQRGVSVCVAVVDASGRLRAFSAMDSAPLIAQDMSVEKAHAALLGMGTRDLAEALQAHPAGLMSFATHPRLSLMGGGLPIVLSGSLVGAIGVGGASEDQDVELAEVALASIA